MVSLDELVLFPSDEIRLFHAELQSDKNI